jgi:hypothetical protein
VHFDKIEDMAQPEPTKLDHQNKIIKKQQHALTVAGSRRQPTRLKTSLRQEHN